MAVLKQSKIILFALLLASLATLHAAESRPNPEMPSPVDQVFQFVYRADCSAWQDGSTNSAVSCLWIPDNCKKVRGLLILCANVPEHRLVGHPAIRRVCADNDLGIVFSPRSFINFNKGKTADGKRYDNARDYKTTVTFLQQILDGLAQNSGYAEVATVPWLPMGESGHILMVHALLEENPQRCMAGVGLNCAYIAPHNRQTPTLGSNGTAQEWGQDKSDIRTKWSDVEREYSNFLKERQKNPEWPGSLIMDSASGHFDCSERTAANLARYVELVAKARLSDDGSTTLKPVVMEKGCLADLPVPGHENKPVKAYSTTAPEERAVPWYFDEAFAKEAQAIAAVNWKAETQLPGCLDDDGQVLPFNFNGIVDMRPTRMESDGITFTLHGTMLERIPAGFVAAGERLATTPGAPTAEWLCGPAAPLGGNRFRLAPGLVGGPIYLALRKQGTATIRSAVQPIHIEFHLMRNNEGKAQKITFDEIPDVKAGTVSIPLQSTSDAGLQVSYYVDVGPAIVVDNNRLVFTKIPPRSRFPIEVTVVAWQWGRSTEPKVRIAEQVKQTFRITSH